MQAEDRAVNHLLSLGWTVVTRRFKAGGGEIDIVALDGDTLVFVEVKFRQNFAPEWSVDDRKTARIRAAAELYLHQTEQYEAQVRFDVIAIQGDELRHLEAAF